jgi:hypothetical protein
LALLDVFNSSNHNFQGSSGAQGASGSGGRAAHQIRRNFGRGQNRRKNQIINRYQKKTETAKKQKVKTTDNDADSEDASADEE